MFQYNSSPSQHFSELFTLQAAFESTISQIQLLLPSLSKPIQIRVREWVRKLASVIDNLHWKRNRNLYSKVLLIMMKKGSINSPFNKMPPDGPLPKLSSYDISYEIRIELKSQNSELNSKHEEEEDKENGGDRNNVSAYFSIESQQSINKFRQIKKMENQHRRTARCSLEKAITPQPMLKQSKQEEITEVLRSSYDLLTRNRDALGDSQQLKDLLEGIWRFSGGKKYY